MELRHLRYFVAVAEEESITRAAARLHLSQPPLSRQLRDLEEELGVQLFTRTPKAVRLTEGGKVFLNEARAALLRVEEAVKTVRAASSGERGRIHVGYAPSLTVELLPRALRRFEEACPAATASLHDLSTEECLAGLEEGTLQVALTAKPVLRGVHGIAFEKLAAYPVCCAVGQTHPLARKKSVRLAQLATERFIAYSEEDYPEYHAWLRALLAPHGCEPHVGEECDSATSLIAAVEAGRGVALVPACLSRLAGPRVVLLPMRPRPAPIIVGAATMRADKARLTQQFLAAVRDEATPRNAGKPIATSATRTR